jgi:hypothetical protein
MSNIKTLEKLIKSKLSDIPCVPKNFKTWRDCRTWRMIGLQNDYIKYVLQK